MIHPKPKNQEQAEEFRMMEYQTEKEGLIEFHKQQGYDKKTLNVFLVNSLKNMGYEKELKKDGLL